MIGSGPLLAAKGAHAGHSSTRSISWNSTARICGAGDGKTDERTWPSCWAISAHVDVVDGPTLFQNACAMGLEGIVAKRRDRPYRSGRSPDWIKVKNPDAPAANRLIKG